MRKKIMWGLIIVLTTLADYQFGMAWGTVAGIPIVIGSWWVAYKSGWCDGLE